MASATALVEETVNQLGLHARCIEAAVHQPGDWRVVVNGEIMPVYVEAHEGPDGYVSALFIAGPMPEGTHYVSLELGNHPMYGAEVKFSFGEWWKHQIQARLVR